MTLPSRDTEHPGWEPSNKVARNHHVPLLMADVYSEPGLEPVSLAEDAHWRYFTDESTAAFRFHSLTFLNTLTETYRSTGDPAYATKARELALRWIRACGTPDDSPAWHGHATGLRTGLLAYLFSAGFATDDAVRESLRLHADHLSRDENYEGAWNHGLDQNIALLRAARALDDPSLGAVASARLDEAAVAYVDAQGVVAEQAPHYAVYIHKQLGLAIAELSAAGLPISAALHRRNHIPGFLLWATRPDGYVVQVGDSMLRQPSTDVADDLAYWRGPDSPTPPPASRQMIYDDGWAFIRSGWGENRPAAEESHLTVRYGTYRRIHGHRDHTSILWYTHGRPVLEDPGFSGYSDKVRRSYELSEVSHSVVSLTGAGPFDWKRGTDLREHTVITGRDPSHELHLLHLTGVPYRDTVRTRSIAFLPHLDILLVRDEVRASAVVRAHQTWQFGATFDDVAMAADHSGSVLTDPHGTVHIKQYLPIDEGVSHRGSEDPMAGWAPTPEAPHSPAFCLRWAKRGRHVGFLTSISTRDDVDVSLGSQGTIRIAVHGLGDEPLARLLFDPDIGFRPLSLPPTGRWDHVE